MLASKSRERLGIEVETGKLNVVENVRNGLRSRFTKIVIVATDKKAFEKIERQLAQAGLLIPSRIITLSAGEPLEFLNSDSKSAA